MRATPSPSCRDSEKPPLAFAAARRGGAGAGACARRVRPLAGSRCERLSRVAARRWRAVGRDARRLGVGARSKSMTMRYGL